MQEQAHQTSGATRVTWEKKENYQQYTTEESKQHDDALHQAGGDTMKGHSAVQDTIEEEEVEEEEEQDEECNEGYFQALVAVGLDKESVERRELERKNKPGPKAHVHKDAGEFIPTKTGWFNQCCLVMALYRTQRQGLLNKVVANLAEHDQMRIQLMMLESHIHKYGDDGPKRLGYKT